MSEIQSVKSFVSFETIVLERSPKISNENTKNVPKFVIFIKNILKRIWFAILNTFVEFCAYSSIHGIRHLHTRVWYEKVIFNIFIIASIVACILIVRLVRFESSDNPIIVSYGENSMTVMDIPFPAITICPQPKASHKKFDCGKNKGDFLGNRMSNQDL